MFKSQSTQTATIRGDGQKVAIYGMCACGRVVCETKTEEGSQIISVELSELDAIKINNVATCVACLARPYRKVAA